MVVLKLLEYPRSRASWIFELSQSPAVVPYEPFSLINEGFVDAPSMSKSSAWNAQTSCWTLTFVFFQVRDIIRRNPGPSLAVYDYILAAASLLSVTLYIIYLLVRKRKLHLPDAMMICLLVSLFMAILCFMLITVPVGRDRIGCKALAGLIQYFFLASSLWGNAMAFSIIKTLFSMSLDHAQPSKLKFYTLYAMGCPLICIIVAVALSKFEIKAFTHPVYRQDFICFLHERITLYATFLIPLYASIAVNVIIATIAIIRVVQSGGSATIDKSRRQRNLITAIKLSVCLGVGWVFLFIAAATGDAGWYLYMQIFVELQGVLVVLANLLHWSCLTAVKSWTESIRVSILPTHSTTGGHDNEAHQPDTGNQQSSDTSRVASG